MNVTFGELRTLEEAYSLWERSGIWTDDPESSRERSWKDYFAKSPSNFLAAYSSTGELIGTAVVFFDGRKTAIYRLAVDAEYRRAGIARQLVNMFMEISRGMGAGSMYALVRAGEDSSANLFESEGFQHQTDARYFTKSL